jgi:hypothetical protein
MKNFICLISLLFISGCTSNCAAPYIEVTHQYQLPPEIKNHKIFLLGGGWSDRKALWVVVDPNGNKVNVEQE